MLTLSKPLLPPAAAQTTAETDPNPGELSPQQVRWIPVVVPLAALLLALAIAAVMSLA